MQGISRIRGSDPWPTVSSTIFRVGELFDAFAEPDFHIGSAMPVERRHPMTRTTEQLLVDLLANRFGEQRRTCETGDESGDQSGRQASADALNGLTAMWAVGHLDWSLPDLLSKGSQRRRSSEELLALRSPADEMGDLGRRRFEPPPPQSTLALDEKLVLRKPSIEKAGEQPAPGVDLEASETPARDCSARKLPS